MPAYTYFYCSSCKRRKRSDKASYAEPSLCITCYHNSNKHQVDKQWHELVLINTEEPDDDYKFESNPIGYDINYGKRI